MTGYAKHIRKPDPGTPNMPLSVAGLAEACGVSRQRIYLLVKEGLIHAIPMSGGYVVMPQEVRRVLGLRVKARLKGGGEHVRFDFSKI